MARRDARRLAGARRRDEHDAPRLAHRRDERGQHVVDGQREARHEGELPLRLVRLGEALAQRALLFLELLLLLAALGGGLGVVAAGVLHRHGTLQGRTVYPSPRPPVNARSRDSSPG